MPGKTPEIIICNTLDDILSGAAIRFSQIIHDSLATKGRSRIALSGGRTPKGLYTLLAKGKYSVPDWKNIQIFWSDERAVPPDDIRSNFRMANESLLKDADIPSGNIHRIKGELGQYAVPDYESEIEEVFGKGVLMARFDLMLLGMGEDGHTASLFPGTGVSTEGERGVAYLSHESVDMERISLTAPVINNSFNIIFMVAGTTKSEALMNVLHGDYNPDKFPAQITRKAKGSVTWFIDKDVSAGWIR